MLDFCVLFIVSVVLATLLKGMTRNSHTNNKNNWLSNTLDKLKVAVVLVVVPLGLSMSITVILWGVFNLAPVNWIGTSILALFANPEPIREKVNAINTLVISWIQNIIDRIFFAKKEAEANDP